MVSKQNIEMIVQLVRYQILYWLCW